MKPSASEQNAANQSGGFNMSGGSMQADGDIVGRNKVTIGDVGAGATVIIDSQTYAPRRPQMAQKPPPDFVNRPEQFETLIRLLLDNNRTASVAITAALHGAGGYGKTTMAQAICHDPRIQQAYPDGILWAPLSESRKDLIGLVTELIRQLTGLSYDFKSIEAAQAWLSDVLGERKLLMVIDDVWNAAHLKPFMQGGVHCARLITTRNRDTLPPDIPRVNVDAMSSNEACALLGHGLPSSVDLSRLAKRLGYWPLLIRLVNKVLRGRVVDQALDDALRYVEDALTEFGLTAFDAGNAAERDQAVSATVSVSLNQLKAEERHRYLELAIFPDDVDIPLATLAQWWGATGGLSALATERLCEQFEQLSLLVRFDLQSRRIGLHDVMRQFIVSQQRGQMADLHQRFLSSYHLTRWADLPLDERYLWEHLTYHLAEARHHLDMFALIAESNAWAEAHYKHDESYTGYLADLERAWAWAESDEAWNIGRQIRCALIQTSVFSLAGNIPPELLRQLVETKTWSTARAMAHVLQIPFEAERAKAIVQLAPFLFKSEGLMARALASVLEIRDEEHRLGALNGLADYLPETLMVKALAAAPQIQLGWRGKEVLRKLAARLPKDLRSEAFKLALEIQNKWDRVHVLADLSEHLPYELKLETLSVMQALVKENDYFYRIAKWHLYEELFNQELRLAKVLEKLAPHLSTELKAKALEWARTARYVEVRAALLRALAAHLNELIIEALKVAEALKDDYSYSYIEAVTGLIAYLPRELKAEVLDKALDTAWGLDAGRTSALIKLAAHVSEDMRTKILREALRWIMTASFISSEAEDEWAQKVKEVNAKLPEIVQVEIANEVLEEIQTTKDEKHRARAFSKLAAQSPDALKSKILQAVRAIKDEYRRAEALGGLFVYLPEDLKFEAWQDMKALRDSEAFGHALSNSVAHLPDSLKAEALQSGRFGWDHQRVPNFLELAKHLPQELKAEALQVALHEWRSRDEERAHVLIKLALCLPDDLKNEAQREALEAAREISDKKRRARILGELALQLPEDLKAEAIDQALKAVWVIDDEYDRVQVLMSFIPRLSDKLKAEVSQTAQAIENEQWRAEIICELVAHLPKNLKAKVMREALQEARAIRWSDDRDTALKDLALHLPMLQLLREGLGLKFVQAIRDKMVGTRNAKESDYEQWQAQGRVLSALVANLLEMLKTDKDKRAYAQVLSEIVPYLTKDAGAEILSNDFVKALGVDLQHQIEFIDIVSIWKKIGFVGLANERRVWSAILRALARHDRKSILEELVVLAPLIEHLGRKEAIDETFCAIRDVGQWWP